ELSVVRLDRRGAVGGSDSAAGVDDGGEEVLARQTVGDAGQVRAEGAGAGVARLASAVAEQVFSAPGVALGPVDGLEQLVPDRGIFAASVIERVGQRGVVLLEPSEDLLVRAFQTGWVGRFFRDGEGLPGLAIQQRQGLRAQGLLLRLLLELPEQTQ